MQAEEAWRMSNQVGNIPLWPVLAPAPIPVLPAFDAELIMNYEWNNSSQTAFGNGVSSTAIVTLRYPHPHSNPGEASQVREAGPRT